ncbi:amidohydrolase family protein [Candidatus Fermentibacteria bacterium]|nr:amidohydrolase family protein [Candidatus Fermentibacteria bacterium]
MIAIKGGRIHTVTSGVIEDGVILFEGGKIAGVGTAIDIPSDAEVIDAGDRMVFPGFIDAHCHVGNFDEGEGQVGYDGNEMTNPVTPHLRAWDGIYPQDIGFRDSRSGGISCVCVLPGSANVIGGLGAVLKTRGDFIEDMILSDNGGLKVAFGENPKRVYGEQKKTPSTRMGTAGIFRETLTKAQNYREKLVKGREDPDKMPERDLGMEVMVKVLDGEIPLRAHAHRADDIVTAIRIAKEFGLRISIEHCTEGHMIAQRLADEDVPAIVGPSLGHRSKREVVRRTFETAGILDRAGVKVALMTDHPFNPIEFLPLASGLAHRAGMTEEKALRAITINPAEILGLGDRIGSIEPGKDADISIWSGHPFDTRSKMERFLINGYTVYPEEKA